MKTGILGTKQFARLLSPLFTATAFAFVISNCGTKIDYTFDNPADPNSDNPTTGGSNTNTNSTTSLEKTKMVQPDASATPVPDTSATATATPLPGASATATATPLPGASATATATPVPSVSATPTATPVAGTIITVNTSPTPTPTPTVTATAASEEQPSTSNFLNFPTSANRIVCSTGEGDVKAVIPNSSSSFNPKMIYLKNNALFMQKFTQNATSLENVGIPIQITGVDGNCTSGLPLTPVFQFAFGNNNDTLWAITNCTGDNTNRYWKVSVDSSGVRNSNYIGNAINYSSCMYNKYLNNFKCGNTIFTNNFEILTQSISAIETTPDVQISTPTGYAYIKNNVFSHFTYATSQLCVINLNSSYNGLVYDDVSQQIILYNGTNFSTINTVTCTKTANKEIRTGSSFINAFPTLFFTDNGKLTSFWKYNNSAFFDSMNITTQKLESIFSKALGTDPIGGLINIYDAEGIASILLSKENNCTSLYLSN